jgi:hypothetical protein
MDLSTSIEYREIFKIHSESFSYLRRKNGSKIAPNYDSIRGYGSQYMHHSFNYADMTYNNYKRFMIARVRQCESIGHYHGMIVNRGGHPKTNTTETCYRHLRRMIKDGVLRMEKRKAYGRNILSVLVVV